MELAGKIYKLGENLAGTNESTGNSWVKKTVVIETMDTTPKKVAFEAFGDRIVGDCCWTFCDGDPYEYKVGDLVKVSFAPRSREHEGRWFTELSLYAMTLLQKAIV